MTVKEFFEDLKDEDVRQEFKEMGKTLLISLTLGTIVIALFVLGIVLIWHFPILLLYGLVGFIALAIGYGIYSGFRDL